MLYRDSSIIYDGMITNFRETLAEKEALVNLTRRIEGALAFCGALLGGSFVLESLE